MRPKHDYTLPILVGLGIAALWYLSKKSGPSLTNAGNANAGATTPGVSSPGNTGFTNPALSPIGTTAAQSAGSTALTTSLNVGATNPFTITSMSWS
jgi:hypothetical protein